MKKVIMVVQSPFKKVKKKQLNIVIGLLLIVVILTMLVRNIVYNLTNYSVEFYRVTSNKTQNPMRIIFLSDLHLREYGKNNETLLGDVQKLTPDLIILGGDFVVEENNSYDNMIELCKNLTEIAPVYGVLGNHEDVRIYIRKDNMLKPKLNDAGVRLLVNEAEILHINGNKIVLAGIDGFPSDFEDGGAKAMMERFDRNFSGFKIVVAHVPVYFTNKLEDYNFELGIAGHVHGGVIRIPKIGALYSHEEGFFPNYAEGSHKLRNNAELIVSRGLGHGSLIPRINNIPELTVIDIN